VNRSQGADNRPRSGSTVARLWRSMVPASTSCLAGAEMRRGSGDPARGRPPWMRAFRAEQGPAESPRRCPYDNERASASAVASRPERGCLRLQGSRRRGGPFVTLQKRTSNYAAVTATGPCLGISIRLLNSRSSSHVGGADVGRRTSPSRGPAGKRTRDLVIAQETTETSVPGSNCARLRFGSASGGCRSLDRFQRAFHVVAGGGPA